MSARKVVLALVMSILLPASARALPPVPTQDLGWERDIVRRFVDAIGKRDFRELGGGLGLDHRGPRDEVQWGRNVTSLMSHLSARGAKSGMNKGEAESIARFLFGQRMDQLQVPLDESAGQRVKMTVWEPRSPVGNEPFKVARSIRTGIVLGKVQGKSDQYWVMTAGSGIPGRLGGALVEASRHALPGWTEPPGRRPVRARLTRVVSTPLR